MGDTDNPQTRHDIRTYYERVSEMFAGHLEGKDANGPLSVWRLGRAAALADSVVEAEVYRPRQQTWSALRVLWGLHLMGATDPGALSRLLDVAPPTISSLLSTLERVAMITRAPDPLNRRRVVVTITQRGIDTAVEALSAQTQSQQRFVDCLSAGEQETLNKILEKLIAHYSPSQLRES